jgi:solute:Na+ symporter, SSS family
MIDQLRQLMVLSRLSSMIKTLLLSAAIFITFCGEVSADIERIEVFEGFENKIETFGHDVADFIKLSEEPFTMQGAFTGLIDGKVILAGGRRADGSLSDEVYWFAADSPDVIHKTSLNEPIAFGGDFEKDGRLYCAGGINEAGETDQVCYLSFTDGELRQNNANWRLPEPLARFDCAYLDGYIFIAGGSNKFYVINEAAERVEFVADDQFQINRPALTAHNNAVYVIGGKDRSDRPLSSVYKLDYEHVDGIKIKRMLDCPAVLGAAVSAALGQSHIFVSSPNHSASPLIYHTITDSWVKFDQEIPQGNFVAVVKAGRDVVFAGQRGIYKAVLQNVKSLMRPFDYILIAIYLAALVGVGFYFSKRESSTENFFVGGRNVPTWAVAFSIFATGTSGISFMAIPAKAYMTNLLFFGAVLISVVFSITLAFILPYLRRLEITSVYEYLEMRFDKVMRLAGATVCLVYQLGARMSVAMYIPAVALTAVTGIDIKVSILAMGILATAYTVLGGIEAVIWSDVI